MGQNNPIRLTAFDILIYLRQRLLVAIEKNEKSELEDLAFVFGMLEDLVYKYNYAGNIDTIIEKFERTAIEYATGITWKITVPSEEEIRSALENENAT